MSMISEYERQLGVRIPVDGMKWKVVECDSGWGVMWEMVRAGGTVRPGRNNNKG